MNNKIKTKTRKIHIGIISSWGLSSSSPLSESHWELSARMYQKKISRRWNLSLGLVQQLSSGKTYMVPLDQIHPFCVSWFPVKQEGSKYQDLLRTEYMSSIFKLNDNFQTKFGIYRHLWITCIYMHIHETSRAEQYIARQRYIKHLRGRQPKEEIHSYCNDYEGLEGPTAIQKFRPRGKMDVNYVHDEQISICKYYFRTESLGMCLTWWTL